MTTTPIAGPIPGLIPGQAGPSAGQSAGQSGTPGSTGDAFLALVQGLLDDASAQPPADLPATATCVPEGPGHSATEDPDLAAPAVDVPVTPLPDLAAMVVPVFVPAPVQPTPQVQADATIAETPANTAPAGAIAPVAAAPTTDKAATTGSSVAAPAPDTSPAPGVELPDVAVQRVDSRPATSDQAAAPTSTPSVAPVSGVAPVATANTVAPTPSDTHRVSQQVFPEVVRVATNPDGPQRVTLKLNPEALGEVRVVLTSRRGGLEVSLAAGSDARAALTEGAPELQRLLEAVGRGDSRIVVRDLFGAMAGTTVSQPAATPSSTGVPTDLAGGAGTGTGRPGGDATSEQQSRNHTTGSNGATDGTQGTTNPSRPIESDTRAHSGLDVSM